MVTLVLLGIFLIAEPLTGLHKRGLFFGGANPDQYNHIINMVIGPILTLLVIASVWIAGRWLDHRKFADFGLVLSRAWWTDFVFGLAMGALLMSGVFLYEYLAGWVVITGKLQATASLSLSLALLFTVVKDLCVGIYEEVVARGYQLTNLMEGFHGFAGLGYRGAVGASIVASSLIFGVLHGFNDNSSFYSDINLAFIGVMFAVAYVATGKLGLSMGLHMSWNFFQGTVFGLAVSGDKERGSFLVVQQGGPHAYTGGVFGPEAGLLGTAAAGLGIFLILLWVRATRHASVTHGAGIVTSI